MANDPTTAFPAPPGVPQLMRKKYFVRRNGWLALLTSLIPLKVLDLVDKLKAVRNNPKGT